MRLSLTDRQLALVRDAAAGVPPDRRSRFLVAVADRLLGCVPTDDDVAEPSRNVNVWYRAKAARRGRTGDENDPKQTWGRMGRNEPWQARWREMTRFRHLANLEFPADAR